MSSIIIAKEFEIMDMERLFDVDYIYEDIDFYREARNSFLSRKFGASNNISFEKLELSFKINNSAKNAPLIFMILDSFSQDLFSINKNDVCIIVESEEAIVGSIQTIADVLAVAKTWKSTSLKINGIEIGTTTEFGYFTDYLFEKNDIGYMRLRKTSNEVKNIYRRVSERPLKRKDEIIQIEISDKDVVGSLKKVIDRYVDIYGKDKAVNNYYISDTDQVILIEDSLVVDFRVVPMYGVCSCADPNVDWKSPYVLIQEMTHNDLFKFVFSDFQEQFKKDHMGVEFMSFRGILRYQDKIEHFEEVNNALPDLKLEERFENYSGELYHYIIIRMEKRSGKFAYGIGHTKTSVHNYVMKLCKELEEKNSRSLELNGASCLSFGEWHDFVEAFLEWKGEKKKWRLENKFSYYYEDRNIKNDADVYSVQDEIFKAAINGVYDDCEFGTYTKPVNRWKSEELVFNITKKLYKEYQVVYQHKPFYLSTERGNMSYDVYICGLKIAIEYQGKQHFEPVEYFGGMESFLAQQERDKLKAKLSADKGVKLIYINYWEDITPALIKSKIENALE